MTLILALDRVDRPEPLVENLCNVVSGFKIGLPLILRHGVDVACRLRRICPSALWIADLKLADIGPVMVSTVSPLLDCVDAIIAHAIVGIDGALGELKQFLDSRGKRLILVVAMSHPGAMNLYNRLFRENLMVAKTLKVWGIVAPATSPAIVTEARRALPNVVIFSPGVGIQGAKPGQALCAGANYEIVGRLIVESENPIEAATNVLALQSEALRECRRT